MKTSGAQQLASLKRSVVQNSSPKASDVAGLEVEQIRGDEFDLGGLRDLPLGLGMPVSTAILDGRKSALALRYPNNAEGNNSSASSISPVGPLRTTIFEKSVSENSMRGLLEKK